MGIWAKGGRVHRARERGGKYFQQRSVNPYPGGGEEGRNLADQSREGRFEAAGTAEGGLRGLQAEKVPGGCL